MENSEPHLKKISCSYCGDAPVNHTVSFFGSLLEMVIDRPMQKFSKYIPNFLNDSIDYILGSFFEFLALIKIAKFSKDINKANTFRSRVIWEEAIRRGFKMDQIILIRQPLDYYRAYVNGEKIFFKSLPIKPEFSFMRENWDDKAVLKRELKKHGVPVPNHFEFSLPIFFDQKNMDSKMHQKFEEIFQKLTKPIIVKPRTGSRGRHTSTNIQNLEDFKKAIVVAGQICPYLITEEHFEGSVCRATFVDGVLAGFYRAQAPFIVGDGKKTILELINEKNLKRHLRVEPIIISREIQDQIARSGFSTADVLPKEVVLSLTHRMGRLFGGQTREMIDELHPSFVPILEKAAKVVNLPVLGFDCIVPDPTQDQAVQKWGIIECNTLPFIDLHYYALEGRPRNIAGMIWDMWK